MIYHVTTKALWLPALDSGWFVTDSLNEEGFIHASTITQVPGVLQRYYCNQDNLLLLHVDENLLVSPIKWEMAASINEAFPHVYGAINIAAVVKTEAL